MSTTGTIHHRCLPLCAVTEPSNAAMMTIAASAATTGALMARRRPSGCGRVWCLRLLLPGGQVGGKSGPLAHGPGSEGLRRSLVELLGRQLYLPLKPWLSSATTRSRVGRRTRAVPPGDSCPAASCSWQASSAQLNVSVTASHGRRTGGSTRCHWRAVTSVMALSLASRGLTTASWPRQPWLRAGLAPPALERRRRPCA